MSIILKTQPANSVSNPAYGKRTIFFTDDGDMKIKAPDGTVAGVTELESSGNTQVVFNSNGAAGGNSGFTFNNSTGTLTVSNLTVSNTLNASNLSVSVISNGNSNVSIPSANGNITVGVSGTANVIIVSNTSVNIAGTLNVSGNINAGNIGATNAVFTNVSGNGSALSSLAGGNVTGAVAFATTANSVAGANVSGAVAFATTANSVAGGNVSGAVAFATTANSVAGANVSGQVGNALVAGTVYTNAQPNITSVGTLTGLSVNGNITAQNITANTGVFTGNGSGLSNLAGANVSGAVAFATTANSVAGGNVTGQVGNALVAGTVYTNAQPNITSVGVLSSLSVTGNITTNANVVTDLIVGRTAGISIESAGTNQPVFLKPSGTGAVNVWGAPVSNVGAPVSSTDAATKEYVDNIAQGLHTHAPCSAATPDTLANISSGTITYNNGSSGVGATLTTTGSYATIDGVNIASVGTRILVKNEANAAHNGIYTYTSGTVLTRATDFDTPTEMAGGDFTFVQNGTLYNDTGWVMTDPVTTVGTTSVNFVQFSGAGAYTAGTGLTLNGTQFSISNTAVTAATYGNGDRVASFTVNSQGQLTNASNVVIAANAANLTGTSLASNIVNSSLTSVGTLTGLSVNGNITAQNITANTGVFTGNGSGLTNLAGGNVTGAVAFATTANSVAGGNVSGQVGNALVAGTVYTNAQPNITSVGTLTSLAVTGNVTSGNVYANSGTIGASLLTGTLTTAAQPNITSIGTLSSLAVTGNVTAGNVYANSGTIGASLLTGTLTTAAQPNITSVGTLSSLAVTGNVSAGNIVGIFANGNSNISIPAANGNINISAGGTPNELVITNTGINVAGTLNATGNANVGNLGTTGLIVSGTSNLGPVSNVTITGGSSGQVLSTNGSGVLSWSTPASGNVTLTSTEVAFGSGSNTVTSSNNFIWDNANFSLIISHANRSNSNVALITTADSNAASGTGHILRIRGATALQDATGGNVQITGGSTTGGGRSGGSVVITGGIGNGTNGVGGNVVIVGGNAQTSARSGGNVVVMGGTAGAGIFPAGNTIIRGGLAPSDSTPGVIIFETQTIGTNFVNTERFRILANGAWSVGTGGSNTGTSGQVLTSQGSGSPPIWSNVATAGTVTTNAQPNITSVGTLSSLSVTGNVTAGNIVGIFANGNSNISIPAANGNITFATAGSERMRLNTNGNFGIGTSSPGQKLDVFNGLISVGGSVNGKVLGYSSSNTQIMDFGVSTGTGLGTDVGIYNLVSGNITFGTNSIERMRINSSGSVGIGINAPQTPLTLFAANATQISGYDGSNTFIYGLGRIVNGIAYDSFDYHAFYTNSTSGPRTGTERMRITSAGEVIISNNTFTPTIPFSTSGARFQLIGDNAPSHLQLQRNQTSTAGASVIAYKSNGTTTSPTIVSNGDTVTQWVARGYDGTNYIGMATITMSVDGTPGTNDMPGCILFHTTPDGGNTLTERMRISNTGTVTINAPSSGNALTVTGDLQTTGYVSAAGYITAVPAASITSGTLTATQRGQCISANANVTVPASIFATGDTVSIYNNTSGNITIVQGASLTLRQVGTANTGNRTLAQRGFSTIWFVSATEAVISGGGLS